MGAAGISRLAVPREPGLAGYWATYQAPCQPSLSGTHRAEVPVCWRAARPSTTSPRKLTWWPAPTPSAPSGNATAQTPRLWRCSFARPTRGKHVEFRVRFAPHALGRDQNGRHVVLAFEYGGLTLGRAHWACLLLHRLRGLQRTGDPWRTDSMEQAAARPDGDRGCGRRQLVEEPQSAVIAPGGSILTRTGRGERERSGAAGRPGAQRPIRRTQRSRWPRCTCVRSALAAAHGDLHLVREAAVRGGGSAHKGTDR